MEELLKAKACLLANETPSAARNTSISLLSYRLFVLVIARSKSSSVASADFVHSVREPGAREVIGERAERHLCGRRPVRVQHTRPRVRPPVAHSPFAVGRSSTSSYELELQITCAQSQLRLLYFNLKSLDQSSSLQQSGAELRR